MSQVQTSVVDDKRKYMLNFPESLVKVVQQNDFEFLIKTATEDEDECLRCLGSPEGNIFHFAAYENNVEFMKEAIKVLPDRVVQSLFCQERAEDSKWNPLHVAADRGYRKIVKVILEYYRFQPETSTEVKKPWLGLDGNKSTPLRLALLRWKEGIALDILSMDIELLSNVVNNEAKTPLYTATYFALNRVAVQILTYAPNCKLIPSMYGVGPLSFAAQCSAQVFHMLVDKAPQLIISQSHKSGRTVLHHWVDAGKLYPFEYVLNNNDIITPDLRKGFIEQLGTKDYMYGRNPLHCIPIDVSDDGFSVKIAQVLVNPYKEEMGDVFSSPEFVPPWLMEDKKGCTPLHNAISFQREQLALYLFSLDSLKFLQRSASRWASNDNDSENDDDNDDDGDKAGNVYNNLLVLAIRRKCMKIAEKMLSIIHQNEKNTDLLELFTFNDGRNVLTIAPLLCTATFLKQLLEAFPSLLTEWDDNANRLLHHWINTGCVWAFEYILKADDINPQLKTRFIGQMQSWNRKGSKPLHFAAASKLQKEMVDIVKLFIENYTSFNKNSFNILWSSKDNDGNTPIGIAIFNKHEELALIFLSNDHKLDHIGKDTMFEAIDHGCHKVIKFFLEWTTQHGNNQKLLRLAGVRNVLHVAWKSTEENGQLIVQNWPELINEDDNCGRKPLETASENGKPWLVKLILQQDRSSIEKTPLAWVEACKNGHVSTVLSFVENSPYFRSICRQRKDTPLHHIQKVDYKGYKQLLENTFINEQKNAQNADGETPLHLAIKNNNKDFAEVLLTTEGVDWNLKDSGKKRAKDLLREKCEKDDEWRKMCELIGVHHMLNARYIDAKTDLMEMRNTVSVVATLLATITITAGFAVPGGFNSNGDAVLSGRVTFWVFVISNTYAMCCAILILFCNTWSMVSDNDMALRLIDRSLWLLKQSLYGTLVAFTVAMYTVIHKKSLWAAIFVAIMVFLAIILAQRTILYKILNMFKYFEDNPPQIIQKLMSLPFRASSTERITLLSAAGDIENQAIGVEENIPTMSIVENSS